MKYLLLSAVFLAATLHAQTAKVIQLSPEDAAQAKSLHEQKEALDKKIADLQQKIHDNYLSVEVQYPTTACIAFNRAETCIPRKPTPAEEKAARGLGPKKGWESGKFEYSDDFKFIVPAPLTFSTGTAITCGPSWIGGTTLIPATGTYN